MKVAGQQPTLDSLCERDSVSREDDVMHGHSFHPDMRQRFGKLPRFTRDAKSLSLASEDVPSSCQHAMNKAAKWASVYLDYVCPHGVSYGSSMVPEREKLSSIYLSLREHLGATAHCTIVYDYACGLSRYAYYRDPRWALQQVMVVDRFHARGHKHCSPGYSFKYNQTPAIATINTSAAEQRNVMTKRVARQVRFMTGTHAVLYMAHVRAMQNAKKNRELRLPSSKAVRPPSLPTWHRLGPQPAVDDEDGE
jgi:hypothetical protein